MGQSILIIQIFLKILTYFCKNWIEFERYFYFLGNRRNTIKFVHHKNKQKHIIFQIYLTNLAKLKILTNLTNSILKTSKIYQIDKILPINLTDPIIYLLTAHNIVV